MINIEKIKSSKGISYTFNDEPVLDANFVKKLRKKLNMSQSMFALLMHVQKKTVEKWEQGKNPIVNGNAVAMILFDKYPELVENFIKIHIPEEYKNQNIVIIEDNDKLVCNKKRVFNPKLLYEKPQQVGWNLQPATN